jgi:hypothetical protein
VAKVASSQKPAQKVHHKRRTEDELRKALRDYAEGKPLLRDDEREETLADGITELIEMRRILLNVQQSLSNLHSQTIADIQKILSPQ